MVISIREATFTDLSSVQKCNKRNLPIYYSFTEIVFIHFNSYNKIVVAEYKGNIVGYVIVEISDGFCHIISLGVDDQYRRLGIGKKLLSVIEQMTKTSCKRMSLYVHVENNQAILFYKKVGLKVVKVVKDYYRGAHFKKNNDDALFMVKDLV